ncbi:BRCT domain-containing protein [Pasteurella multocida]
MDKCFVYINTHKEIKAYFIKNINQKNNGYFSGMSEDYQRYLTFRTDRVIKYFDTLLQAQEFVDNIPIEIKNKFFDLISSQCKTLRTHSTTFCFTGFKKAQKDALIKLANENNLRVVGDVSPNVNYLVACENSKTIGPRKLAKAEQFGIKLIYEDQFFYMIETGEIPQ